MKGSIQYHSTGRKFFLEGKEVTQEEFDEAFPNKLDELFQNGFTGEFHTTTCWPQKSEALAVHPKRINEAIDSAKKKGVPTRFDRAGRPVFESRQHRKRYLKAYGYHDNQGGYGD